MFPRCRIGGMFIKYGGWRGNKHLWRTKVASAALQEDIDLSKARGRKPQWQITCSSRLGVRRWASNPSLGKIFKKLKIVPNNLGWSRIYCDFSYEKGQWILEPGMSKESSIKWSYIFTWTTTVVYIRTDFYDPLRTECGNWITRTDFYDPLRTECGNWITRTDF